SNVRGEEPLKEPAQIPIPRWPERHVNMSGHEAVGKDAHGHTPGCGTQQCEKCGIVLRLPKDLGPSIAPIDDMVAEAP
ncbi:MAG TPA: hypothetical protein VEP29_03300, partial [Desulfatiglandales bacterium]|nr:hypothetical protein [Desulfatiglandales bacterium]